MTNADYLEKAARLIRKGDYDAVASDEELVRALKEIPPEGKPENSVDFLAACAMLSEQADQRGHYKEAWDYLQDHAELVVRALQRQPADSRLTDARARYVLRYAVAQHRRNDHARALFYCSQTQVAVEAVDGASDVMPLLLYWQGRFFLHQDQYDDALGHFIRSMRLSASNLNAHFRSHGGNGTFTPERACCLDATQSAHYRTGSALAFGVASVYQWLGRLKDAYENLLPALTMLQPTADRYRYGLALLILGTVERQQADLDPAALKRAHDTSHQALESFRSASGVNEHSLYEAWADLELAETCMKMHEAIAAAPADAPEKPAQYLDDARHWHEEAQRNWQEASKVSGSATGVSFRSLPLEDAVRLTWARLEFEKRQFDQAIQTTSDIVQPASPKGVVGSHVLVEALILRGQALLSRNQGPDDLRRAVTDFEMARKSAKDKEMVPLYCLATLLLVDTHLTRENIILAHRLMKDYERSAISIEEPQVLRLAESIREKIENSHLFLFDIREIDSKTPPRKLYDELEARLRHYCVEQAFNWGGEARGAKEAADRLGVSRATIFKWRKNWRSSQRGR